MFPLFIMLFVLLGPNREIDADAYPNNKPATKEECEAALLPSTEVMKEAHPGWQVVGWCVEEDWPFEAEKPNPKDAA